MEIRLTTQEASVLIQEYLTKQGYQFVDEDADMQVEFLNDGSMENSETFRAFVVMP